MAKKNVEIRQLKLALSTGAAQNLSQMQAKLLQEFTNSAELLRDDMNRVYTHFIAVDDLIDLGGELAVELEKVLDLTEQTVEGSNRIGDIVVEGEQKQGKGILNAFEKVKRETKKLFGTEFFKGKAFGHQDITPSGIRLAALAEGLELVEKTLIKEKATTKRGEGRVKVDPRFIELKQQNIAGLRKVKAVVQKMIIASALVEKMPMTKSLKNAPAQTKYLELAKVFNETRSTKAILRAEKKKFINVQAGKARIGLKIESKEYNDFKNKFQSPFGTNASNIFKGQNPSTDLSKFFINKVKIGKLKGSDSIEDKIVKDITALAKGQKIKAQNTKSTKNSGGVKLNTSPKIATERKHKKLVARGRKVSAKASRPIKKGTKGKESATENQDLFKLEKLINKRLPAEVRRNMGRPALRNQTGRFSNSVQLESLRPTAKGLSGEFSYQLSPYETFENTGSRRWPTGYNPKPLIAKSIRNLAMQYTEQKFVSLRRT